MFIFYTVIIKLSPNDRVLRNFIVAILFTNRAFDRRKSSDQYFIIFRFDVDFCNGVWIVVSLLLVGSSKNCLFVYIYYSAEQKQLMWNVKKCKSPISPNVDGLSFFTIWKAMIMLTEFILRCGKYYHNFSNYKTGAKV